MPLLGENAIRFKASESDRMDVASPIAARMRKAADLTAQATSFDDFERLDPEISAGDTLINFGQQADFGLWQGLETRAQRHLTSDGDSIHPDRSNHSLRNLVRWPVADRRRPPPTDASRSKATDQAKMALRESARQATVCCCVELHIWPTAALRVERFTSR